MRKNIMLYLLLSAIMMISSCSCTENYVEPVASETENAKIGASKSQVLTVQDPAYTLSLKNSKIYLLEKGLYYQGETGLNPQEIIVYVITDGQYNPELSPDGIFRYFVNASYIVTFGLVSETNGTNTVGDLPVFAGFYSQDGTTPLTNASAAIWSYSEYVSEDAYRYTETTVIYDDPRQDIVSIKGGLNPGDNISVSFSGLVAHSKGPTGDFNTFTEGTTDAKGKIMALPYDPNARVSRPDFINWFLKKGKI